MAVLPVHGQVSIHAFREEGDTVGAYNHAVNHVSIHAFREEGDAAVPSAPQLPLGFNPRLPGGRRLNVVAGKRCPKVSIHAFREEGDVQVSLMLRRGSRFNPRLPGGRRRRHRGGCRPLVVVSIHAFREEGDSRTRP